MRKLALSIIVAFAVYVTAAVAQSGSMGGSSQQGTQGQSPTAQPGQTQPGQPPEMGPGSMGQDQNGPSNNTGTSKSEKKLKGCVQSQNGQYVLETKKGNVALTGQDVSAHVGHEVAVKGAWQSGGNLGASSSPTASGSAETGASSKAFNVTDVEMVSETCKIGGKHSSSGTGSGASSSSPGYGNSTGNSTGGSNSGSGSTTPPQ